MRGLDLAGLRFAYAFWLFGIFVFVVPAATWSPASRFALTRALVEHHTLTIDPYASSTGDRALVAGQWFTEKAPLPSLAAAVPYAVLHALQSFRGETAAYRSHARGEIPAVRLEVNRAYQQGLYLSSALTSGLAGVCVGLLTFELLRRRTRLRAALLGSIFVTLGTPIYDYATSFYGHTPAAAFLLGALVCLDPYASAKGDAVPPARLRWAGLCLACAPGCEYMTAVPSAVIAAFFLLRSRRRADALLQLAAGALVPVLLVCGYHWLAFGAPWRTGYSFITNPQFRDGQSKGLLGITALRPEALYGLTFGVSRGLFFIAPVALLGLVYTARRAIVRADWCARVGLLAFALLFLLNASYFVWWGGAAAGPRHLVPALGFLAIGLGDPLWARAKIPRYVTLVLGAVSIANVAALALVGIEAPEFGNVLTDFAWRRLLAGHISTMPGASNVGFRLGFDVARSLLLFLAWFLGGLAYILAQVKRTGSIQVEGELDDEEEGPRLVKSGVASSRSRRD
jgi:hypothetical protein